MAEQNIWKKQMQANKNKGVEPKAENPVANTSSNPNPPPWMKNNQPSTSGPTNTPAWMKNNSTASQSNQSNSPSTGPAWMKQNQDAPSATSQNAPWAKQNQEPQTGNTAPWAKNNTNSPSQPPWGNKSGVNPPQTGNNPPWASKGASSVTQPGVGGGSNPPWMKKEQSGGQSNNSWKLKQMAQVEKQKKQREQKNRQLQEEEKERKRIEKLQKQKEQQQKNIQRQLSIMARQDEQSKQRQAFQKQEILRIQREKQQKQRKEKEEKQLQQRLQRERKEAQQRELERLRLQKQQKEMQEQQQKQRLQKERLELQKIESMKPKSKLKKSKRNQLQTSKLSHISSIKGGEHHFSSLQTLQRDQSQPQNLFHKYTRLMNDECNETDYRNKIAIQKLILQTQLQFKRQCQKEIISLVSKKKITNRKRKVVFSNNMQIRYGLCQGKKADNGLLYFNAQDPIKLKSIFLYYEAITKCILGLLKKKLNIHFRVPLINLAEYKGITFLIEYTCQELGDINQIDIGLFQEISNEVLILEKELQLSHDARNDFLKPLTKNQLMVKKVNIYDEDYYILYIKEESLEFKSKAPSSPKSNKVDGQLPNITYLKFVEYLTGQSCFLPFYVPPFLPLQKLQEMTDKIVSPAYKTIIKQISLAHSISTVYSSCQGEVEENIFFDLILGENKEIWDMIKVAGFSEVATPSSITLAYLQSLASLRFNFYEGYRSSKKIKELVCPVQPNIYIQKHQFQMLQFIKNLQKYIAEDKEELVQQSIRMSKELWEEICKPSEVERSCENVKLLYIKQQVSYFLYKNKIEEALEVLTRYQQKISALQIQNIPIALMFIKIYVKTDAQIELLKKLSQLLKILQFYFKEETIIHSYVYTIVGSYYSKKEEDEDRETKVITFYEHAIKIALQLYGQKAVQVAEVYLSRANSMLSLNKLEAFQKDMQQCMRIYRMHSKNNSKMAQAIYLLGKVNCLEGRIKEGIQQMESSSNLFLKLQNYIQSLTISFEILYFLEGEEGKYEVQIERIVQVCFRYKSVWAFKKIVTILLDRELQCYTSLSISTLFQLFAGEEEERSNEEILIDLEEQIKGFTSFIQIIRWSLSILAAKVVTRKEATSDYWKALSIMKEVTHFYLKQNQQRLNQSVNT